jgi:aromatic ring-cleaving dioxygenase
MMPEPKPANPDCIRESHARVYFRCEEEAQRAAWLREEVAERFPQVRIGRWHAQPVGPHTEPMYQLAFHIEQLPKLLPWLMLNRRGLCILFHPEADDAYADHAYHAAWLGMPLPLRLESLPAPS